MRYLIMHTALINDVPRDCLFKVVCGPTSFAQEQLAAAIAATGDRTMRLEAESAADRASAWY